MDVVGTSPERFGGVERVTGSQLYLADLPASDALHVKLVTLDCAHGRIDGIDTSLAERVPGVRLIMTAADLPDPMPRFGMQHQDRPILAIGETKYHGEPVAAVAAETREAAAEAAGLVRVEHTILPAISTTAEALDPESPLVQDPSIRKPGPLRETNTIAEYIFGWGDLETAEPGADLVVEGTYSWPMQTHFAIEPHGFMAAPDGDGIVVWSTIQHPYQLQKTLAGVLDLPLAKVRVIAPDPGGGFGGKQHAKMEPLLAFMALKVGRPVRLILTLAETFQAVRRTGAEIRVRTGLKSDGTLVFQDYENNFLHGAYAGVGPRTASKPSYVSAGPYRTPAVRIVSRSLFSHTTPTHPLRGFGVPQVSWAREQNLDEAARRLGIDPLDLRMMNLPKHREQFIPGDTPADGDWAQAVTEAARLIGWANPRPEGRGRGLALGLKSGPTTGLSYSRVRLLADGSAIVAVGTSDMGQGARTVFAQITAEELGIPLERITVVSGDTAAVPYDQQTSASRSTVLMGNAVLSACGDLNGQIAAMAARLYGVPEEEVGARGGVVRISNEEIPADEVMLAGLGPLGGELSGNGEMRKHVEPDHPLDGTAAFYEFNCTAVEVEVDEETGETNVLRHVSVGDAGRVIHPAQTAGQDDGAAIMGLGQALMEYTILDDGGRIRNLGAVDYRIPTIKDLPGELISATIENADGPGPYGAKGVSEGSLLCVAPAVAAAIRDATGAVIRDLPLTPQRVWEALQE